MTRGDPNPDIARGRATTDDGPTGDGRRPTRRTLLRAAGTGALVGLAGCSLLDNTRRYEAAPAVLSQAGPSAGFTTDAQETVERTRTESVGDLTLEITLISELRTYNGDPDDFGCFSTPAAEEAGQQLNPLADRSFEEILRNRAAAFLGMVRTADEPATDWERGPERLRSFDGELLGSAVTATTFAGTTTDGEAVVLHAARTAHEGDIVIVGGGRSKDVESTDRPLVGAEGLFTEAEVAASTDTYRELLPDVEHPAGEDGESTTTRNLEGSPFTSISVEPFGAGYKRIEATVEIPAGVGEGFTEREVVLMDPKRVADYAKRNPDLSSSSPSVSAAGRLGNAVDMFGDVSEAASAMVTEPLEKLLGDATPPPRASLRSDQTPLRNQWGRNTCVVFAVCAAMEAYLIRQGYVSPDLSEQYGQHIFQMTSLNQRKSDPDPTSCVRDKRNGPIDTDGFDNGLGMVGGGGLGRELPLFTEYGLPDEWHAKFQTDPGADRTYVYDGDFAKTHQPGADPQGKWCNPKSATQREANDFNVEHRVIDVPINNDRTLRMRPFPREALKNADWRLTSYVRIGGNDSKLSDPEWYERWIGDIGREVMVSYPTGSCTKYNKKKPKRKDFSSDADHLQAVQKWRNDHGDVYMHDGSEDCDGAHCVLLVGYKRDANPPHFIAKNSWNTYTKLGYDIVNDGEINEAGVITGMKQSSSGLREQDFLGRWDLTYAGLDGILDIYRKPGYYDSSELWGAQDRRIGTFFDSNGRALRVNGTMQSGQNRIEFSWGSGGVLDYGEQGNVQFTGYMDPSDRDFMAGTYDLSSNTTNAFFAVPKGKTTRHPVVQYSSLQKESFLGQWHVRSSAFDGVIDIESTTGGPAHDFSGTMREAGGATGNVSGTADQNSGTLRFVFPTQFGGWEFDGYIHAPHSLGNISGRVQRVSGGDTEYAPMKLTRIGLADPYLKILEPVEGATVSAKSVTLQASVTGDPNPGSALIWTVDGPYNTGGSDAGSIIATGTPATGAVSAGEHTIHATYTNTSPSKTDTVDVTAVQ